MVPAAPLQIPHPAKGQGMGCQGALGPLGPNQREHPWAERSHAATCSPVRPVPDALELVKDAVVLVERAELAP